MANSATNTGNVVYGDQKSVEPEVPPLQAIGPAVMCDPREPRSDAPAPSPPPVWARYINSRLKQFGTR